MKRKYKTHCKHGHKFTEKNTRIKNRPDGRVERECKACQAERTREAYYKTEKRARRGIYLTDKEIMAVYNALRSCDLISESVINSLEKITKEIKQRDFKNG